MEAANIERMREVLDPYSRLDVPAVYQELSSARLLVMEEVEGVPVREAPVGDARRDAARQLLDSYYDQILTVGFFHADPHPGNLKWWNDKIYFLDFGMVGEVDPETREHLLLLLMAFWRGGRRVPHGRAAHRVRRRPPRRPRPRGAPRRARRARATGSATSSLKEIQLGPILQGITEIAARHEMRLPASLALTGKALAQMQLTTAELDPTLDPFAVAGDYLLRRLGGRLRERADPQRLALRRREARVRLTRLVEAIERLAGARPGPRFQVQFSGTEQLEDTIRTAARRVALAILAGTCIIAPASPPTRTGAKPGCR